MVYDFQPKDPESISVALEALSGKPISGKTVKLFLTIYFVKTIIEHQIFNESEYIETILLLNLSSDHIFRNHELYSSVIQE